MSDSKSVLFTIAAILLTFGLTACGGSDGPGNGNNNSLSSQDFRDYCSELKSCLGESAFDTAYSSVDDCASTQRTIYQGITGACDDLAADFFSCQLETFECNQQSPQYSCSDEEEAFTSQCDGIQL